MDSRCFRLFQQEFKILPEFRLVSNGFGCNVAQFVYRHEGQCVLLAIWGAAGDHMKQHLEQYTLAGIANAARGVAPWPAIEHTH